MTTVLSAVGEATGLKPDDQVIAQGMLAGAKSKASAYCLAICETVTPELRHLFTTHLNDALAGQERLSKLVQSRGWYKATAEPAELVKQAVKQAQPVLQ
ncbi:MAG TPA: spore coat protein [Symbiobacteriaceae bacterium]|jgi:similar to spore coat protein|nr:spore coat protein [Symbiobacteriaceae bacterium]